MTKLEYIEVRKKRNELRDKYEKATFLESRVLLPQIKALDRDLEAFEAINPEAQEIWLNRDNLKDLSFLIDGCVKAGPTSMTPEQFVDSLVNWIQGHGWSFNGQVKAFEDDKKKGAYGVLSNGVMK